MSTEERIRFEVLLENLQTSVNVIAEGHGALVEGQAALVERLDRMESRFETRFDRLEIQFKGLETKVDGLEVFAGDAQRRLKRIESHLQLNGSSHSHPPPKAAKAAPPKPRKKP